MKKVYIIVPVFKRENFTANFIESILSQSLSFDIEFIIVDDDHELYGNYERFAKEKKVTCIKTHGNAWWCGTVRQGIDYFYSKVEFGSDDIVVIANNDVTIPQGELSKIIENVGCDEICHPQTFTNRNVEISSGAKVITWFPFITKHPKFGRASLDKIPIDLCTARFMCMHATTLSKVGNISNNLLQYQGDYDFSLIAKSKGITINIIKGAYCQVYDDDTGLKSENIASFSQFLSSFYEIRSSNNLKYRWRFVRNHFSFLSSVFIIFSMVSNIVARYVVKRFK